MNGDIDYRDRWERAVSFPRYLAEEVEANRSLWLEIHARARTPAWAARRAAAVGGRWKLLVLAEDWCGDASNTVPVLTRFAEDAPNIELRIIKRDENPDVMDRYLTNGTRSIPMAILLDESFEPAGAWGPRPAELQELVIGERAKAARSAREIYADARRWYARDRGRTTLRELLDTIAAAATAATSAASSRPARDA